MISIMDWHNGKRGMFKMSIVDGHCIVRFNKYRSCHRDIKLLSTIAEAALELYEGKTVRTKSLFLWNLKSVEFFSGNSNKQLEYIVEVQ